MVVNSYPQHLAKDLIVGIIYISSFLNFFIIIFFFCFQTLLLNWDRKGPFQPTFIMKITPDSMECVWENITLLA